MMGALDGISVPVSVSGPHTGTVVVLLAEDKRAPATYDGVCGRLHNALLRTVVIGADPRLTPKSVLGILDQLKIPWAVLVGDRAGAELAWELAATTLGRFSGMVVVDRGHPRVADIDGAVRDETCPPVEVATTVLMNSIAGRRVADDSQRYVYGDYRVVDMPAQQAADDVTAQLITEIILRASSW